PWLGAPLPAAPLLQLIKRLLALLVGFQQGLAVLQLGALMVQPQIGVVGQRYAFAMVGESDEQRSRCTRFVYVPCGVQRFSVMNALEISRVGVPVAGGVFLKASLDGLQNLFVQ